MRILCLHGKGTNGKIFELQTGTLHSITVGTTSEQGGVDPELHIASLRYELGDGHVYDFIEGSVPCSPAPGVDFVASPDDEFLSWFDETSYASCCQVLEELDAYIASEGPFDAVMAFSQGAILAATLMVSKSRRDGREHRMLPLFRCAIFLCGGQPFDPSALLRNELRVLDCATDGEIIQVPTANIWGANDLEHPTYGLALSMLCTASLRTNFIHSGGHEIPGPRSKDAITGIVRCIRRTIDRALNIQ